MMYITIVRVSNIIIYVYECTKRHHMDQAR